MPSRTTCQLIRNATVKLRFPGFTMLVDPCLADPGVGRSYAGARTSPLVPLPLPIETLLADIDAIFVSHLHSDHFDDAARRHISRDMLMLCPQAIASELRKDGFKNVVGIADEYHVGGLTLKITGGRHGPDEVLADMGPVNGFLATLAGTRPIYWVGDSIWCPDVAAVIGDARPGTVIVHACGADWDGHAPLVMDEAMVEATLRAVPDGRVIATHMDCVDHATVSRASLRAHFTHLPHLAARLSIPEDGEVFAV